MRLDRTPERPLGGEARWPETAFHAADAESLEMRLPGRLVREMCDPRVPAPGLHQALARRCRPAGAADRMRPSRSSRPRCGACWSGLVEVRTERAFFIEAGW